MPLINLSFADFDTVCYSNQHNIIELIKHCVGFSVQINMNTQALDAVNTALTNVNNLIQQLQTQINNMNNSQGGQQNSITQLQNNITRLDSKIDAHVQQQDTMNWAFNQDITNLRNRIIALEQKVN